MAKEKIRPFLIRMDHQDRGHGGGWFSQYELIYATSAEEALEDAKTRNRYDDISCVTYGDKE